MSALPFSEPVSDRHRDLHRGHVLNTGRSTVNVKSVTHGLVSDAGFRYRKLA